jgi:hypothetical protein
VCRRRLALTTGFGSQIVWNRSNRCAGERGGARVGRPRWLRILTITGGSSITPRRGLAMIHKFFVALGIRLLPQDCLDSPRCRSFSLDSFVNKQLRPEY